MAEDANGLDEQIRCHVVDRMSGMRAVRSDIERDWMDVGRFLQPRLGAFLNTYGERAQGTPQPNGTVSLRASRLNQKLLDGHGVWASGVTANGMMSGLSSASRPWFTLETDDPGLNHFKPAKVWLDQVKKLIYEFFASTNFYQSMKSTYLENAVFGTEVGVMLDHWRYGGVTHGLTAGEYWISLNDALQADSLYRRCDMTAKQMAQKFGVDKLPRKVREAMERTSAAYENRWEVYHAIEPNDLRQVGKMDTRNKRMRGVYWTPVADKTDPPLLAAEGFDDQPFWCARWDIMGSEPYGYSPGMNAYADARQLQFQSLRKQQAIDWVLKPALRGPALLTNQNPTLQPGRIVAVPGVDKDTFSAIWQVEARAVEVIAEDIMGTKQAIDRSFYVDLFMAITNMPGIQPKTVQEIAQRNEEKMQQLGPVVERVNTEKLKVAIDRAFMILLRQGRIPPPPPEMHGRQIKVQFISILAQMMRILGLGSIERGVNFVGSLVAVFPEAGDKLDIDKAIDSYFELAGTPADIVRSDDEVKGLRDARAKQQAQMQAAAGASAAAPAAKDAAQAAQIMAQTDVGGSDLLSRLTGPMQ